MGLNLSHFACLAETLRFAGTIAVMASFKEKGIKIWVNPTLKFG